MDNITPTQATWKPIWILLSEAAKASRVLTKCGCKAMPQYLRKCRCRGTGLSYIAICQCGGNFEQ